MWSRVSVMGVVLVMRTAAADPETPQLTHSEADRENEVRLREDQRKLDDRRAEETRKTRQVKREAALRKLDEDEWDAHRDADEHGRHVGIALTVVGGVLGGVAVAGAILGVRGNHDIEQGTLASQQDVVDTVTYGKIYNDVAIGAAIAGGLFVLGGTAKILLNLDQGDYQVAPLVTAGGGGISFGGAF